MAYEQYGQNSGYQQEPEMGWNDVIDGDDSNAFETLPEGDYYFTVTNFTRARYEGGKKIGPCNKAILTLALTSAWEPTTENPAVQGEATVNLLVSANPLVRWKLSQFFIAIGYLKHGEQKPMNWNIVPGSTGTCAVTQREWTGDDGKKHTGNDVKRFYDPEKTPVKQPPATRSQRPATPPAPNAQQRIPGASASGSGNSWSAGKF